MEHYEVRAAIAALLATGRPDATVDELVNGAQELLEASRALGDGQDRAPAPADPRAAWGAIRASAEEARKERRVRREKLEL